MIATPHENYNRLKALIPDLEQLTEQESVHIPLPVMDCQIRVQKHGPLISRLELGRGTHDDEGQYVPDHKMQIRVNHDAHTIEPDKIWFMCGGTTFARGDEAKQRALSNTLARWLDQIHSDQMIAQPA